MHIFWLSVWKLVNKLPFLVNRAEIWRWFGSGHSDFFPTLFKDLMFRATESNHEVLSYQEAKIKKERGPK